MAVAGLLIVGAFELACVGLLLSRTSRGPRIWILAVVGAAMAYDSLIFGLGAAIGAGDALHGLSVGRFVGHALLTPLLILWAVDRAGAGQRWRWAAAASVVVSIAWGVLVELVPLELVLRHFGGTVRYSSAHPALPIPALAVTAALFAAGIVLWRREANRSLASATVALTVASGAAVVCPPLGNAGEAVVLAAMVAAELAPAATRRSRPDIRPGRS